MTKHSSGGISVFFSRASSSGKRSTKGEFLVEAIVAVGVSGIIAVAMGQMYANIHKAGNISQGEFLASHIAQSIIDHLRAQPFANVQAAAGLHRPQVVGPGLGNADPLFPRALLQDTGSYASVNNVDSQLDYTGSGNAAVSQSLFNVLRTVDPGTGQPSNTVDVLITNTPLSGQDAVTVNVTVAWTDGRGQAKTYRASSMLTRLGLQG